MSHFQITQLPLESTGSFEKTIISYIKGHDSLKKLYDFEPNLEGFKNRIAAGPSKSVERRQLVSLLKSQYQASGLTPEASTESNIESLIDPKTFCVTTGHQLNIFSGPLYVLFKLLTTINLAEKLKIEFPDHNFVPIYWMATEDHDIAEINHFSLFSKKIIYETTYEGKSGKLKLDGFDEIVKNIVDVLGESAFAKEITDIIFKAYSSSKDLADATRKWTNALLGKYGLVIIDADEILFKKQFSHIIRKELSEQFTLPLVNKASELLKTDFTVQVNPREINLFYIKDGARNRIVKQDNSFQILNTDILFSDKEIMVELNDHPERFSPNVLLRPIYQEMILPNIAYIGGPSELTYWLELKFVFDELKLTMPILMLRNCAMIADRQTLSKWHGLGFKTIDIFRPENELMRTFLENKNLAQFSLADSSDKLVSLFDQISKEISAVDQSLKATADSEKQKALNSLKLIEEKVIRALKKKEETEINQIKKIKEKFFPGGGLQERSETLIPSYIKWGGSFIDDVKKSFDPFDNNFIVFEEN